LCKVVVMGWFLGEKTGNGSAYRGAMSAAAAPYQHRISYTTCSIFYKPLPNVREVA